MKKVNLGAAIGLGLAVLSSWAEAQPTSSQRGGVLEIGGGHADLDGQNPDWEDYHLRGQLQQGPDNVFFGEVSRQRHFGEEGTFLGAGLNHVFSQDWYGSLSLGSSDTGFFLPAFRGDAALYRKWLPSRRLVTGVGYGYYRAREVYTDHSALLSAIYYFEAPVLLEVGARLNRSDPGKVDSQRGYAALTYGRARQHYVSLRYDSGRESYQLVAANALVRDFSSDEASLGWRQWLAPDYGFQLRASRYDNPSYRRNGIELGLFKEF